MNRKGFTLVELLVMLVVLSVLIGIAVPNITGILRDNKNSMTLNDANRMLDSARVKATTEPKVLELEYDGDCTVLRLSYLDKNDDYKKGPNDGSYDKSESFVVIQLKKEYIDGREEIDYQYFVRLIEKKGGKLYGINMSPASKIEKREKDVFKNQPRLFGVHKWDDITNLYHYNSDAIRDKIRSSLPDIVCSSIEYDFK